MTDRANQLISDILRRVHEAIVERLVRAQGLPRAESGEVSYGKADAELLRTTKQFIDAGVTHYVLYVRTPFPDHVATRIAEDIIAKAIS